jgi:hypothetical protein
MAIYFKDVQSLDEEWCIELGNRMTHRLKQLSYDESLAYLTKIDGELKKGTTLYPFDQILIRIWDKKSITANWYLLDIDVLK